jgi:hypothetical protein
MTVTLQQVLDYLSAEVVARWAVTVDATTTYPQIQDALTAEAAAQARRVRYPDGPYPDLDEALKRRVQRNLAMRPLPLAVMPGNVDTGAAAFRPGGSDPEIRRLEGPYRRLVAG